MSGTMEQNTPPSTTLPPQGPLVPEDFVDQGPTKRVPTVPMNLSPPQPRVHPNEEELYREEDIDQDPEDVTEPWKRHADRMEKRIRDLQDALWRDVDSLEEQVQASEKLFEVVEQKAERAVKGADEASEKAEKAVKGVERLDKAMKKMAETILDNNADITSAHHELFRRVRRLEENGDKTTKENIPVAKKQKVEATHKDPETTCPLCPEDDHRLGNCPKYPSPKSRLSEFRKQRICTKCCKPGCEEQDCPHLWTVCKNCKEAGVGDKSRMHHASELCYTTKADNRRSGEKYHPRARPASSHRVKKTNHWTLKAEGAKTRSQAPQTSDQPGAQRGVPAPLQMHQPQMLLVPNHMMFQPHPQMIGQHQLGQQQQQFYQHPLNGFQG